MTPNTITYTTQDIDYLISLKQDLRLIGDKISATMPNECGNEPISARCEMHFLRQDSIENSIERQEDKLGLLGMIEFYKSQITRVSKEFPIVSNEQAENKVKIQNEKTCTPFLSKLLTERTRLSKKYENLNSSLEVYETMLNIYEDHNSGKKPRIWAD